MEKARIIQEFVPGNQVTLEAREVAEQPVRSGIGLSANDAATTADAAADIRAAVLARLPAGTVPAEVIEQLVCKVVAQKSGTAQSATGTGSNTQVNIADVITAADGSSMAAGFMQWENAFFPWTLNYDEVDMVLEGELHIRSEGKTTIGKAGDVMFIPKGSSIEFGTPGAVKFLYVAYPANWQECGAQA